MAKRLYTEPALTFDDVLLVPQFNDIASRKDVDISSIDKSGKLKLKLPIMSANMDTITGHKMANFMTKVGGIGVLHRFMSIEDNVMEFKLCEGPVFVSIGCGEKELERAKSLFDVGSTYFCIDVAHAHSQQVRNQLHELRKIIGVSCCIMAGNVVTEEAANFLSENGADIVKAGVGSGSVCSTRIKSGHGMPQLTAISESSNCGVSVVADGNIRSPGDIVKAFAFGSDFVMIGGMLSGTSATPGDIYCAKSGRKVSKRKTWWGNEVWSCDSFDEHMCSLVKRYRGMASKEVNDEYFGGLAEWKTAEGVSVEVPYRTDEDNIIADIVGGIRSGLTYSGACDIVDLRKKAEYVVITNSGMRESLPHNQMG